MIRKSIWSLIKNDDITINEKISKISLYFRYFRNLKKGLKNGEIFSEIENQNDEIREIINKFEKKDFELINKLFSEDVIEFLKDKPLKKKIDFTDKKDFLQVGINTVYLKEPILAIWTTGISSFFMPTIPDIDNKIEIDIVSIAPLEVIISTKNGLIIKESLGSLASKDITITLPKIEISGSVSEILISTNKLWSPKFLTKEKNTVPIGVGIKRISNVS